MNFLKLICANRLSPTAKNTSLKIERTRVKCMKKISKNLWLHLCCRTLAGPSVLLLLLQPKQQSKALGGEGGQSESSCIVERLWAWIWYKACRQRKLENSLGWNNEFIPCPPMKNPPFSSSSVLTDGNNGGWIDGLEGLKVCYPIFEPEESVSPVNMGCKEALVARILGFTMWVHTV